MCLHFGVSVVLENNFYKEILQIHLYDEFNLFLNNIIKSGILWD